AGRGSDLYRRSVYTFWKRTAPHPLLAAFDAPNRETCTVQRPSTSGPLQALAMLNDRTIVDASRALAMQAMATEKQNPARTEFIFRSALTRRPSDKERQRLLRLFEEQLTYYRADPMSVRELVGQPSQSPELAAWMIVAQAVFNLEEFVTK